VPLLLLLLLLLLLHAINCSCFQQQLLTPTSHQLSAAVAESTAQLTIRSSPSGAHMLHKNAVLPL
jgi:hypothetical protein